MNHPEFHIPTYISRNTYVDRIRPFMGKQIIKVLTGQRRVGKSYLLFELMDTLLREKLVQNIMYINKEDMAFAEIREAIHLEEYVKSNLKPGVPNALFVDEIQDIHQFHLALRSLLLIPNLDIYITGSNANLLSSDLSGYLSGRFVEFKVYSLTYREFLRFHELSDSSEVLQMFMKYGGLPYLKHLPLNDEVVFDYLRNIYHSIVYRDVVNRFSVRNTAFLERLIQFLAQHVGSLFSARKISEYLKSQKLNITPAQVQNYLHHLCSAFIVSGVQRYDIQGKRMFEFGEKYFFENTGIRNAIVGYRPQDLGKIMENVVHHQLMASGYVVHTGALGSREIDFVATKGGETTYIQVALNLLEPQTQQREFGNLNDIQDHYPKKVITLDSFSGNSFQGIVHTSLRGFLMESA